MEGGGRIVDKRRVPDEAAKQVVLPKMRPTFFHERPTFFHEWPAQKRPRAWDVFLQPAFFSVRCAISQFLNFPHFPGAI